MPKLYFNKPFTKSVLVITSFLIISCGKSPETIVEEHCACLTSINDKELFTMADADFHVDSCNTFIDLEYEITSNEKLKKEMLLHKNALEACAQSIEDAYNQNIDSIANELVRFYSRTIEKNPYISDVLVSSIGDSLKNTVDKLYNGNIPEEIIADAQYSDRVSNAESQFIKRYNNQAKTIIDPAMLIHTSCDLNAYNKTLKTNIHLQKGDRVIYSFYLPLNYDGSFDGMANYENVASHSFNSRNRNKLVISKSYYESKLGEERVLGYPLYVNENGVNVVVTLKKEDSLKKVISDAGLIELDQRFFLYNYSLTNPEKLVGKEGQHILMAGTFQGYNKISVSVYGFNETIGRILYFDDCEVIETYEDVKSTFEKIDQMDVYTTYLKTKPNVPLVEYKTDNNKLSSNSSCQEFLDGYEKYMLDYLQVVDDYSKNQDDLELMQKAINMASESSKWTEKLDESCTQDPKFLSRYTEIQLKLAKAAEKLY